MCTCVYIAIIISIDLYYAHILIYVLMILFNPIVGVILFKRPVYRIKEGAGQVQPELILSNPSSTNITVEIDITDITATGK